jgi:hypothetical protein
MLCAPSLYDIIDQLSPFRDDPDDEEKTTWNRSTSKSTTRQETLPPEISPYTLITTVGTEISIPALGVRG